MDLKLATWNVRTMLQPGKMLEIAAELEKYSIDVAAIQEIRWQGCGRIDKNKFSILYSGPINRTGLNGVGFFLSKKLCKSLINFVPINDRLCKIRLKGKFRNITIISVYAPTDDKEEEIKEEFYDILSKECNLVPKYDLLLLMGDLNAKIGKENFVQNVAGKYTMHDETTENGIFLCQLAASQDLIIKSTCFNHKIIHKGTWKVPNANNVNQIDHVLVSRRHASSVIDVKTCRGPNCDSDHYLVRTILRERIANAMKEKSEKRVKWDSDKLRSDAEAHHFESTLAQKIEENAIARIEEVDRKWEKLKTVIVETAKERIGEKKKERNSEWFDEECREVIERKNSERQKLLQKRTILKWERYVELRREAKQILRRKKREHFKKKVRGLEEMRERNESRNLYQSIRRINNSFQPKLNMCKNQEGQIISEEEEVIENWSQYFKDLLNCDEVIGEEGDIPEDGQLIEEPTLDEVEQAVRRMKNNKSPGEDCITAELLKHGGQRLMAELHDLICKVWKEEKMPDSWKNGVICPIYKKGDKMKCENYRGITLLNVAYKVFGAVLQRRVSEFAERQLKEYQCGFRPKRSTTDQIFVMRQVIEKCYEYNVNLHILFVDFRQAFDSIGRNVLYESLVKQNIPSKLVRLIKMTLHETKAAVMVGSRIGSAFNIGTGVRQGDTLSAVLFNLALNYAVEKMKLSGTIIYKSKQICAYADDIALVARNRKALLEMFLELENECKKIGLAVNVGKTKYLKIAQGEHRITADGIKMGAHTFEEVTEFKYLGTSLNSRNIISNEIRNRIIAGNRAFFSNGKVLKSKLLTRQTKIRLYKTLVRPVVTYGSESWTLTVKDVKALRIFERKIYRRICGPVRDGEVWRLRHNHEINEIIGREDIVNFIKASRLRWIGHVERMSEDRLQKKVMNSQIIGVRKRGRPRRRWQQDVEEDLRRLNVRGWRERARSRDDWRHIVNEVKVHIGL